MASRQAAQQFGEAFLTTLTQTRRLKKERDLFAQQQKTAGRRLDLFEIQVRGLIDHRIETERRQINTQEFNQELAVIDLGLQGVTETTTSRFNQRTQRQEGAPDAFPLGDKSFLLPAQEEKQPDFTKAGTGSFGDEEFATFFDFSTGETIRVKIGDVTPESIGRSNLPEFAKRWNIYQIALDRQETLKKSGKVSFTDPLRGLTTLTEKQIRDGVTSAFDQLESFIDRNLSTNANKQIKAYEKEFPNKTKTNHVPRLLNAIREDVKSGKISPETAQELFYFYSVETGFNFFNFFK